jgi:radical SAM protein with 4Fe4S-binding SPASM domain
VFHLGRPDVTIPPRVALRRGVIVEVSLLRLAATALTEVRQMGLVITRRSELKRRAKYWLLKLAIQNPPSQHIIHSLVRRDASGRIRIETLLDQVAAHGTAAGATGRTLAKLLHLGGEALGLSDEEMRQSLTRPSIRTTVVNAALTIDKYGLRMPQRFYAPLMVVWNLTYRCNLRCRHCYENAGPLGRQVADADELSREEKLAAVDQIAASYIPTLSISGGEPLLHPDFWPVLARAREKGLYTSIATNGTLITKEAAQRLADFELAYAGISVDSPVAEEHDAFRGVPGAWERAIGGIRHAVKAGVPTLLAFTITKSNYRSLPEIFRLAKELEMTKVMVYNFIPTGRGREMMAEDLTPEMREEALEVMYEHVTDGHSLCTTAPQFGRICAQHSRPDLIPLAHGSHGRGKDLAVLTELVGGCGIGRAYFALQPDGRITPCVYLPDVTVGHVRQDRFLDLWHDSPLLNSLGDRVDLKGHCATCEYQAVCGGCRARAYAYFGDFKGPDPGCINNAAAFYSAMEREEHLDPAAPAHLRQAAGGY